MTVVFVCTFGFVIGILIAATIDLIMKNMKLQKTIDEQVCRYFIDRKDDE